jgi:hypothetical protein
VRITINGVTGTGNHLYKITKPMEMAKNQSMHLYKNRNTFLIMFIYQIAGKNSEFKVYFSGVGNNLL